MNKKFIGGVMGGTLILLALGVWGATRLAQTETKALSATDGAGKVELGEAKYDLNSLLMIVKTGFIYSPSVDITLRNTSSSACVRGRSSSRPQPFSTTILTSSSLISAPPFV